MGLQTGLTFLVMFLCNVRRLFSNIDRTNSRLSLVQKVQVGLVIDVAKVLKDTHLVAGYRRRVGVRDVVKC